MLELEFLLFLMCNLQDIMKNQLGFLATQEGLWVMEFSGDVASFSTTTSFRIWSQNKEVFSAKKIDVLLRPYKISTDGIS